MCVHDETRRTEVERTILRMIEMKEGATVSGILVLFFSPVATGSTNPTSNLNACTFAL